MDKKRIKRIISKKYIGLNTTVTSIIDIVVDAVELSDQDEHSVSGQALQMMTDSMTICYVCDGRGYIITTAGNTKCCARCDGTGAVMVTAKDTTA